MKREFMQWTALALLGLIAACSQKPIDTGSLDLSGFSSGSIVAESAHGGGSGGHLAVLCSGGTWTIDPTTGKIVCQPTSTGARLMESGGHQMGLLVMDCSSKGPGQEVVCTAPMSAARKE